MPFDALHIGDLHFWKVPLNPAAYAGKRLLGVGNLVLRRGRIFKKGLAGTLVERARALDPKWVLFSGDFTTTATAGEYRMAAHEMAPLEAGATLRAVPGNHDRYTRTSIRRRTFEAHLGPWCHSGDWPWVEPLAEGVVAAGVDFTTSNGMGSFGRVLEEQLEKLKNRLNGLAKAPRELWFVCHFPAEDPPGAIPHDRGIQLHGADALVAALRDLQIPVRYLHGHHHYRWVYGSPTAPNVTYVNAGAPLMARPGPRPDLGFYRLRRERDTTRLFLQTWKADDGSWAQEEVAWPASGEYKNLQRAAM